MAIDPALITTKQVSELPPNPLAPENLFPHQVGDILSQATIQQLVDYVRSQSFSQPYEIKYIRVPSTEYITDNFDMAIGANQGLGKVEGLWDGWAVCNGNNGTDNLDGITLIGHGANYNTVGQFLGSATHTLSVSEMPSHYHTGHLIKAASTWRGGGDDSGDNATSTTGDSSTEGGNQAHNNMQPSMVVLIIMKL